jgi:hypothetical protein
MIPLSRTYCSILASLQGERAMKQIVFGAVVACVSVCGTSIAAPIAPVPIAVITKTDNVIQAYYYHKHYYHRYYRHHYYRHW